MSLPYTIVYFDISGTCNAVCPWCDFGGRRRGLLPSPDPMRNRSRQPFTDARSAEDILRHLLKHGFISQDAIIGLYNWGEPLLNPNLEQILLVANRLSLKTEISTNGSIPFNYDSAEAVKSIAGMRFSIPGYSQASYDYAHGFNAESVRENIKISVMRLKNAGCSGNIEIHSHIYRANFDEIPMIRDFAASIGVNFHPGFAYPNSKEYYVSDSLRPEVIGRMRNELFFISPEDALKCRPKNYTCPQWSYLTLSWNGKMNLCCCNSLINSDETEMIPIKDISPDESLRLRINHPACKICIQHGLDFLVHEPGKILRSMVEDGRMPPKILTYLPPTRQEKRQARWEKRRREIREKGVFAFLKKRIFPKWQGGGGSIL